MNLNELDQYLELINSVLLKSAVKLNKWREKFMLEVLLFSMMSVKVLCHNIFLMRRFISILGIEPDEEINRKLWEEGIRFAAIAA